MSDQPSVLKRNSTDLERALERAWQVSKPDLSVVSSLFDPMRCPAELLGWLAWSFSVDVWDRSWSDAVKRSVVADAIALHRVKGTRAAVLRAVSTLDYRADLSEWFETGDSPHTFRIDVFGDDVFAANGAIDQQLFDQVSRVIETVKPVRSHFALRVGETHRVQATAKAGLLQRKRHQQGLTPQPRVQDLSVSAVLKTGLSQRVRHGGTLSVQPRRRRVKASSALKTGLRLRQCHRAALTIIPREGAAYAN
jgi:phage tail P2-like protein